jgi:hypothetical protein
VIGVKMECPVLVERRKGERRKKRSFFYYPERRTGFDRRRDKNSFLYLVEYFLSRQSSVFLALILFLNLANLFDLYLTKISLEFGFKEANLILNWLILRSLPAAVIFKIGIIAGVSYLMWRFRQYRYVVRLALFTVAMFLALLLYEISLVITVSIS